MQLEPSLSVEVAAALRTVSLRVVATAHQTPVIPLQQLPSPPHDPSLVAVLAISVAAADAPLEAGVVPKGHRPAASPAVAPEADTAVEGRCWAARRSTSLC